MRRASTGLEAVPRIACAIALALLPVAPVLLAFASASAAAPGIAPQPPWASYNTGRVSVVFPTAIPRVELYQNANTSVNAVLQLDGVFELSPGNLPHPTIVAQAMPTQVARFNATTPADLRAAPLGLVATLEVRTAYVSLWGSAGPAPAIGGSAGLSTLTLSYASTPSPSTGSGVRLNWTIGAWPWAHAGDLLALKFHFAAASAPAIAGCTSAGALEPLSAGCPGETLPAGGIVWDSSITSVETIAESGPIAALSWAPWATLDNGSASRWSVGALAASDGSVDVVLGTPASNASAVSGTVDFSLAAPFPPPPATVLRGSAVVFVATVAVLGGAGLVAIALYRRRERRLRDEL